MESLRFWPAGTAQKCTRDDCQAPATHFFFSDKDSNPSSTLIGGKAFNLAKLNSWEVRVPRWFCVTSLVFEKLKGEMPRDLLDALEDLERSRHKRPREQNAEPLQNTKITEVSEALMAWMRNTDNIHHSTLERDSGFRRQFDEKVLEHFGQKNSKRFAVRSSALGEDSGGNSFAGQFDTFLYVDSSALFEKVLSCFASAFGPRVLSYLMNKNIPFEHLKMAVVVQEMWNSQKSGVLFTCSPDGRLEEISVAAGYGLGEGIVTDRVETDLYRITRQSPEARQIQELREGHNLISTVNKKNEKIVFDAHRKQGTQVLAVDLALQNIPVLSHAELRELAETCLRIEQLAGRPQDVEWGIDDEGKLALLQTRPITTLPQGKLSLCDNSNVSESYPGISSALTFSVVRRLYSGIFESFTLSTGTKVTEEQKKEIFDHLVIHVQGRIYYNLSNWYAVLKMIPGTERFVAVWEEMLGIQPSKATVSTRLRKLRSFMQGMRTYLSLVRHFFKLDSDIKRVHLRFTQMLQEFRKIDLSQLQLTELVRLHEQMIQKVLRGWEITLWNDAFTFIFAGVCKFALGKLGASDPATLLHDLLSGESANDTEVMESAGSVLSVQKLSLDFQKIAQEQKDRIQLDEKLLNCADFFSQPVFREVSECAAFKENFHTHLERYGDRTMNELKLETRTFRQQPEELLQLIASFAASNDAFKSARFQGTEDNRYLCATEILGSLLQKKRLSVIYRPAIHFFIHNARKCMRHRENSRFDRARAYGVSRAINDEIGKQLKTEGLLAAASDVYFLDFDSLRNHIAGETKLNHQSVLRAKELHSAWEKQNPEDRFYIRGNPVDAHPVPQKKAAGEFLDHRAAMPGSRLTGTGSSPGEVTAEAIVLENPEIGCDVRGKILVTRMTDPGWVFLMVNCAGLVSEKGSILSHTAIIGRELGIPTVVGVQEATKLISSGCKIRLNGTKGELTIMENVP